MVQGIVIVAILAGAVWFLIRHFKLSLIHI